MKRIVVPSVEYLYLGTPLRDFVTKEGETNIRVWSYVVVTAGESLADAVVRAARVVVKWPSTVLELLALSLPAEIPINLTHFSF